MSESRKLDPSGGQFIDPMFAVVIAAAVAETVVHWVKSGPAPSIFETCVVSIGYINLLLSWFGYHKSVLRRPIQGSLRFIITVVLLPLYLLTIILFSGDFYVVTISYAMIFFFWTVWEYFKAIEYREAKSFLKLQFRGFNLLVYGAAAIQLASHNFSGIFVAYVSKSTLDWTCLVAIAFAVVFLRVTKSAKRNDSPAGRIRSEFGSLFFGSAEVAEVPAEGAQTPPLDTDPQ